MGVAQFLLQALALCVVKEEPLHFDQVVVLVEGADDIADDVQQAPVLAHELAFIVGDTFDHAEQGVKILQRRFVGIEIPEIGALGLRD